MRWDSGVVFFIKSALFPPHFFFYLNLKNFRLPAKRNILGGMIWEGDLPPAHCAAIVGSCLPSPSGDRAGRAPRGALRSTRCRPARHVVDLLRVVHRHCHHRQQLPGVCPADVQAALGDPLQCQRRHGCVVFLDTLPKKKPTYLPFSFQYGNHHTLH